jgi:hypothetical protein
VTFHGKKLLESAYLVLRISRNKDRFTPTGELTQRLQRKFRQDVFLSVSVGFGQDKQAGTVQQQKVLPSEKASAREKL